MSILNEHQVSELLAERAMRGWDALGQERIGEIVKAYARRFLTRADSAGGECRVLVKDTFHDPFTEHDLRDELDLGASPVRWIVDLGMGGDARDPRVGMVLVVRGVYEDHAAAVVAASAPTWTQWGLDAELVRAGQWPPNALLNDMMGGARRIDA